MQQIEAGLPPHHAARTLAGLHIVGGEHIGDAAGNRRDGHQRTRACHAHQRDQAAVQKDREHDDRDHKAAPRALGEGKDTGQAHHAGAADREHLDPHLFAVVGDARHHRREQHEQAAHDIRAAGDRVYARAHALLGLGDPARRDGRGNDILVNAVRRHDQRHRDQRAVEDGEIAVILDQAGDQEEPEQVLHDRAVAVDRNAHIGRYRAHQEEPDADEQQQIGVHRGGARLDGRAPHCGVPQDIGKGRQHHALVPYRADKPGQIAHCRRCPPDEHVQRQVQRQTDQQQAAHADKAARLSDDAAAQKGRNRLPDSKADAVDQALGRRVAQALDKAPQRRHDARVAAVCRRARRRRAEMLPDPPEARIRVGACNPPEAARDRALMVPLAQAQDRPDEQAVLQNRFHRLIPQKMRYRPCRYCRWSQSRWSLR